MGSHHGLEQADARAVTHMYVARLRADQPGNLGPHSAVEADPIRGVPRSNQVRAPLVLEHLRHALAHPDRQWAKGVAIEVVDAFGKLETRPRVG